MEGQIFKPVLIAVLLLREDKSSISLLFTKSRDITPLWGVTLDLRPKRVWNFIQSVALSLTSLVPAELVCFSIEHLCPFIEAFIL